MEFNVKIWRNYYDQVNNLGQYLKDSYPDWDGNPPKFTITDEERKKVESEIKDLLKMSNKYLDKCRLLPNKSRWNYKSGDQSTWLSSNKFQFQHLLPKHQFQSIRF